MHVGGTVHVYKGQTCPRTMKLLNPLRPPLQSKEIRPKRTGDKMIPWETPISCSHLDQLMGQKLMNEGRQMASKIEVLKDKILYRVSTWCRKLSPDQRVWQ